MPPLTNILLRTLLVLLIALLTWTTRTAAVTVSFTASTSPDVVGYKIYYGFTSRDYDTVLDIGPALSASLTGLTPDATYYIAATAYNTSAESVYSNEGIWHEPPDEEPPADTTPPVVILTNPTNGATVPRNTTLTLRATASDNIKVTKVEFRVNGTLKCTESTSSYTCAWHVPAKKKVTYSLQARAYDAAGNTQNSAVVKVTSR